MGYFATHLEELVPTHVADVQVIPIRDRVYQQERLGDRLALREVISDSRQYDLVCDLPYTMDLHVRLHRDDRRACSHDTLPISFHEVLHGIF